MPTNSAVREMLPPKRLTWARRYSRSKISRASRSGIDIRCSPPALPGVVAALARAWISTRLSIGAPAAPPAKGAPPPPRAPPPVSPPPPPPVFVEVPDYEDRFEDFLMALGAEEPEAAAAAATPEAAAPGGA